MAHSEVIGPGLSGQQAAVGLLTEGLRVSPEAAKRDYLAAVATGDGGHLPTLGGSLTAGVVHREHLDVAVKAVEELPEGLKRRLTPDGRTGLQVIDPILDDRARAGAAGTVKQLALDLRDTLDPRRVQDLSTDAYTRRRASIRTDECGMLQVRASLDPATGTLVIAALEAASAPRPAGTAVNQDGETVPVRDERTCSQRLADAISDAILASAAPTAEPGPGPVVHVGITATVEQMAAAEDRTDGPPTPDPDRAAGRAQVSFAGTDATRPGGTLDPSVLARLACDSPLYRVLLAPSGEVLDVGHSKRLATPRQRKALAVRDRGCVVPGCGKPSGWCDAHHVTGWARGGRTDLDNLVLLCSRHHTAVHAGVWGIQIRDGIPWMIPPPWRDPHQTPLRNTTHEHYERARTVGQQLRLRLDEYPRRQCPVPERLNGH